MDLKNLKTYFLVSVISITLFSFFISASADSTDPPEVRTNDPISVDINSANLSGTVNPKNSTTTMWFEYGKNRNNLSDKTPEVDVGAGNNPISKSKIITGLDAVTTYYYRAAAKNSFGATYGEIKNFDTRFPQIDFTVTSPAPGSKYFAKPILLSGTVASSWCSNVTLNVKIKVYLDNILLQTIIVGDRSGGWSQSFSMWYNGNLSVGQHNLKLELYGNNKLRATSNNIFNIVAPEVDIKANNQDGPITIELPLPTSPHQYYTLSWTARYITSLLTASGDWAGEKNANGAQDIRIARKSNVLNQAVDWVYRLRGVNHFATNSDEVKVKVIQVPQCEISLNPSNIILPQSSTINWSCYYADSVQIKAYKISDNDNQFNDGTYQVIVNNNIDYYSSGNISVRPSETTRYRLESIGLDGNRITSSSLLTIGFIPTIREIIPRW
ncbi:MAG: hypothetical protein Q8N28_02270 [bacterium]|nr:hypothetical protein [bacterium]